MFSFIIRIFSSTVKILAKLFFLVGRWERLFSLLFLTDTVIYVACSFFICWLSKVLAMIFQVLGPVQDCTFPLGVSGKTQPW